MTPVASDEASEKVRAVVAVLTASIRDRVAHDALVKVDIGVREAAQRKLIGLGLSARQVARIGTQAALDAGVVEADLDRVGVKYGGVRRARLKGARSV